MKEGQADLGVMVDFERKYITSGPLLQFPDTGKMGIWAPEINWFLLRTK